MKVFISILLVFSLSSCSKHCIYNHYEQKADLEIQKRIQRVEAAFKKQPTNQPYNSNDLESLVYLSGISPKVVFFNCLAGTFYELNQNYIDSIKNWFEQNKTYLSYDEENEYIRFMDSIKSKCKEKIIVLKRPDGELKNSYGFQDTICINSIRKSIRMKKNENTLKKQKVKSND